MKKVIDDKQQIELLDDYNPFVKFVTDYECQALNNYLTFIQKQQSGPEL